MCIKRKIRDLDLATIVRKAEKSAAFKCKAKADPTGCKGTTFTDFSPLLRLKAKDSASVNLKTIQKAAPFPWGLLFIEGSAA